MVAVNDAAIESVESLEMDHIRDAEMSRGHHQLIDMQCPRGFVLEIIVRNIKSTFIALSDGHNVVTQSDIKLLHQFEVLDSAHNVTP